MIRNLGAVSAVTKGTPGGPEPFTNGVGQG